jgi:hypothetical protein
MTTLKLRKPIKAHGEEIAELTFREPTGKDIREIGVPFALASGGDGEGVAVFNSSVIARYVSRLANVPTSSVDQMSAIDWRNAMAIVNGFFGGGGEDEAPTPPASGTTTK